MAHEYMPWCDNLWGANDEWCLAIPERAKEKNLKPQTTSCVGSHYTAMYAIMPCKTYLLAAPTQGRKEMVPKFLQSQPSHGGEEWMRMYASCLLDTQVIVKINMVTCLEPNRGP